MLIHIVGAGVIGKATGEGFTRFGHQVVYSDKYYSAPYGQADIHFVCTPEQAVPGVVSELVETGITAASIVIRSTTPPGTVQRLAEQHGLPIWHNPEFLRSATAGDDFLHAEYALVGCAPVGLTGLVEFPEYYELYETMGVHLVLCTSTESEIAKLITNAYLASQISFWNDMRGMCEQFGVNSHAVARLVAHDQRVSLYGALKHGAPYAGSCLPKDVQQLLDVYKSVMVDATQQVNKTLGGE